ncbi:MAG: 50S ribosomal protein L23 [Lentisphaerae bacterium RIFOXYC12_FULL_60_16]|nr:MAG: 50S ribosomal protein L23 [Lentisphaerae bacterium RIFOXYC12_FULL_60_16]OGV71147.1 MAG: 50S ribosomal protein L23 [Lentisphaerae bacterium RIFOXYA12_FULL_60_10]OGV77323.1 MAG: 50S ribosomal protein L23 [Lentisphaerae bacterium RIFOXYB12_FULL_60_10]
MKNSASIIKRVQVTEKGTALTGRHNQYLVQVDPVANKVEIKQAVQAMFKVSVLKVNTMRYLGKPKRSRRAQFGRRPDWKRAVVTLKAGEKIELG